MARALTLALALAALAVVAQVGHAHCPNFCNGHGECENIAKCSCWSRWTGGDCSKRKCPAGPAWADHATAIDTAHAASTECSNRGTCDYTTGICKCFDGFEGLACNRLKCPDDCSGHGTCRSMRYHAANADRSYSGDLPGHENKLYNSNWDADMIWGCECDEGYQGYNCALRVCPLGDDPLTTNQVNERQVFKCTNAPSSSNNFKLTYRGFTTIAIPYDSSSTFVKGALEALPNIRGVDVDFRGSSGTATTVCDNAAANPVQIEFLKDYGDVGHLLALDETTVWPMTHPPAGFVFAYDGDDVDSVLSNTGTKESEPCSNRGYCDTLKGVCTCYTGYETSNGEGASGDRGDCGYPSTPITECPGTTSCSGHGVCAGHPTYRCTCDVGWTGGDCSERTCPFGYSWFDHPSDTANKAHFWTECSNMGRCDRETGECVCRKFFEGSACERFTCPGGTPECNGHGKCLNMKQLAEYALSNGEDTAWSYGKTPNDPQRWDFDKVYGCQCDVGYEGYDCSLRVCPSGDDDTTHSILKDPGALNPQRKEVQIFECTTATSGNFQLHFRTFDTANIASTATAADVEAALELLESIEDVQVEFSSGVSVCTDGSTPNYVSVTFMVLPTPRVRWEPPPTTTEYEDVPDMTVSFNDPTLSFNWWYDDSTSAGGQIAYKGTVESEVCSDRGICDQTTGQCQCFVGFGSSDGLGARGGRGDCGFRLPIVPIIPNHSKKVSQGGTASAGLNGGDGLENNGAFEVVGP